MVCVTSPQPIPTHNPCNRIQYQRHFICRILSKVITKCDQFLHHSQVGNRMATDITTPTSKSFTLLLNWEKDEQDLLCSQLSFEVHTLESN